MQQRITIIFFIACLIFAIIIYFPSGLYFLSDDLIHIPLSAKGELFQRNSLRPVHDILLSSEVFLWEKNAFGFHLTALIIHLLCSLCLFWITNSLLIYYKIMDKAKARQVSFLAAGLFLIYAFHSEAVLWILGSGAALCTLFFLLSIGCYLYKERSLYFFLASLVFFQIGLFTYEAIWIAPLCILCFYFLDIFLLKKNWKKDFVWMLAYIISFIIHLMLRIKIMGELVNEYALGNRNINIGNLFLNYNSLLARSFIPPMKSSTAFLCCYALLVALSLFYFFKIRKSPYRSFIFSLICLFLLSFIPYIFLGIDTHTRESERFLYLPSVFLCIIIAVNIIKTNPSNKFLTSVCIFLFLYNAIFTYSNRRDYNLAGSISKSIYRNVSKITSLRDTITVYNLPEQFNGVPVFREGFKEGLDWLFNADTSKIKIANTPMLINKPAYVQNFFKQQFDINVKKEKNISGNISLTIQPDTTYFTFLADSLAVSKYFRTIHLK